jgi:beta propeller repeat protein
MRKDIRQTVTVAFILFVFSTPFIQLQAAVYVDPANEFVICSHPATQVWPSVYGNIVVWSDRRNGNAWSVYGKNLLSNEEFAVFPRYGYGGYLGPSIFADIVVCTKCTPFDSWCWESIKGINLVNGQTFEIDYGVDAFLELAIYDDVLVWSLGGSPWGDIYGRYIPTGQEFPICVSSGSQHKPAIHGRIVVWQDTRNSNDDIYGADISDLLEPHEFSICTNAASQQLPAIHGDIVVWQDDRNGNWDIYGKNLSTEREFRICTNPADQTNPAIYGNIIVWEDERNPSGISAIYGVDLTTDQEFTVTLLGESPSAWQHIAIWEDLVVWVDGYDIHANRILGIPEPSLCDLSISDAKPVQVVFDSYIYNDDKVDLVAGKDTAILVYVRMENHEQLDEDVLVSVRLNFNEDEYITVKSKTIAELQEDNWIEFLLPDDIVTTGEKTIVATVDSRNLIEESNESNNTSELLDAEITVWECYGFKVVYIPVTGLESGGDYYGGPLYMTEYSTTVEMADSFMRGVWPVAENKLIVMPNNGEEYRGFSATDYAGRNIAHLLDILELWAMGERITLTKAQNTIGIVPDRYFEYHGFPDDYRGLSVGLCSAVLVEVGCWTAVAHEIGHTSWFLPDQYLERAYTGDPTNGFWINDSTDIQNGTCFMGPTPKSSYFIDERHVWICDDCYRKLFRPIWPVPILSIENDNTDVLLFSGMDEYPISYGV